MSKRLPPLPSELALAKGAIASHESAAEMQTAAADLLAAGHWPAAYTLAALGYEELGKSFMCWNTLATPAPDTDPKKIEKFWSGFRNHKRKAAMAYEMVRVFGDLETPLPLYEEELKQEANTAANTRDSTKFRALYVDYDSNGNLQLPREVTEAEARALTTSLDNALTSTAQLLLYFRDPRELAEALRGYRTSVSTDALNAVFGGPGRRQAIEDSREAMRSGQLNPELMKQLFPKPQSGDDHHDAQA